MLTLINLLAHSYQKDSIYLLSTSLDNIKIPFINLDNIDQNDTDISIDRLVQDLYNKHINLDYNWAQPRLLDIDMFRSDENIVQTHIYYACYIPYTTTLNNASWLLGDEILPYSKILRKALLCSK
jgi:hypothetical protein